MKVILYANPKYWALSNKEKKRFVMVVVQKVLGTIF